MAVVIPLGSLGSLAPKGYVQQTSLAAAIGLTTVPSGSNLVMVQPETQNVRWRDDGTDPTASVGNLLVAGDTLIYTGSSFAALKFIEVTASAKLNCAYYRKK